MGLYRCHHPERRRLRGPSVLRDGRHRPVAPEMGLPGCRRSPAQLAGRPAGFPETGGSEAVFRGQCRGDGLDGEPLHRLQASPA